MHLWAQCESLPTRFYIWNPICSFKIDNGIRICSTWDNKDAKKVIIKHCRPLRRLAKLKLRSKGVVHWVKNTVTVSNRGGKTPVNKKKLSAARRQLGKEGGCKFSGNGSSQKLVKAKVRKMLRYFNMYSTWPSTRLAAEKWKVSSALWARAKAEHVKWKCRKKPMW